MYDIKTITYLEGRLNKFRSQLRTAEKNLHQDLSRVGYLEVYERWKRESRVLRGQSQIHGLAEEMEEAFRYFHEDANVALHVVYAVIRIGYDEYQKDRHVELFSLDKMGAYEDALEHLKKALRSEGKRLSDLRREYRSQSA